MEWKSVKDEPPSEEGRYLGWPSTIGEVCTCLYWKETSRWQDLEDHTEPWAPWYWMELPKPPIKTDNKQDSEK